MKNLSTRAPLMLLVACAWATTWYTAEATLIDFEAFPGPDGVLGTPDDVPIVAPNLFVDQPVQITTQYASLGILFLPNPAEENKNEILNDSTFVRTAGSRVNLLSTSRLNHPYGPIEARFTIPVFELSIAIGLGSSESVQPNVLEIFDSSDTLIGSAFGSDEVVTLTSLVPISRFVVLANSFEKQAAIDDIRFRAVPEPSTVGLIALGVLGAFQWRTRGL